MELTEELLKITECVNTDQINKDEKPDQC